MRRIPTRAVGILDILFKTESGVADRADYAPHYSEAGSPGGRPPLLFFQLHALQAGTMLLTVVPPCVLFSVLTRELDSASRSCIRYTGQCKRVRFS